MSVRYTEYREKKKTPEQEQVAYYAVKTYTAPTVVIEPGRQAVREAPEHVTETKETVITVTPVLKPPPQPPKSLTEQIIGTPPLLQRLGLPAPAKPGRVPGQKGVIWPLSVGAVGAAEHLVYGLAKTPFIKTEPGFREYRLYDPLGIFPEITEKAVSVEQIAGITLPKPPPTLISATISYGLGSPQEMAELGKYGPEYAVGTVVGDILLAYGISKTAGYAWQRIRGVTVSKLTGAREIEKVTGTPTTLESERLTGLAITKERVPYKYATYLKEMQRYYSPEQIHLGGVEKVALKGGGELDIQMRAYEAFREAGPFVAALKAKTPLVYQYTFIEKTSGFIAPETTLAYRTLTATEFLGKIDTQIYLRLAKSVPASVAQSWYAQMGGLAPQLLEKATPKTITLVSKVIGFETAAGYLPKIAAATLIVTPQPRKAAHIATQTMAVTRLVARETPILVTPKPLTKIIEPLAIRFPIAQRTVPLVMVRTTPITTPKMDIPTVTKPKPTPTFPTPDIPTPNIPTPTITIPKGAFPYLPRGGGEVGRRSFENLFGKWIPRKHPVKPWEKMLGTFGLKVPKGVVKMGKMEVPKGFKAFGFTVSKRRRRRR